MDDEPKITVNGTALSSGQAMAVRVSVTSFHDELVGDPTALGDDEMAYAMAAAYTARLREVLQMMFSPTPPEDSRPAVRGVE